MVDTKTNFILQTFPEVKEIKNEQLREGVTMVWVEAMKIGGWIDLSLPFTLEIPNTKISLAIHTREVTQIAIEAAKVITSMTGQDFNMDFLVAGALLHDVGKLLEYERSETDEVSRKKNVLRHPISGAKLAAENGNIPNEVCHIITTHSWEGDKSKRSPESQIVHRSDFIAFELAKYL
ncbi:MAG: HD domain-containing protein [Candidatus Ranarchaeia archaeon]